MTARSLTVRRGPADANREFSIVERALLSAEIAISYLQVRVRLRRSDVRATLAAVRATTPVVPQDEQRSGVEFANRLGAIVDGRLGHLPGDTRCLTRSLVLLKLLARRGFAQGDLVIGVRARPSFGAHAWVELDGRALNQPMEASGSRLVEL